VTEGFSLQVTEVQRSKTKITKDENVKNKVFENIFVIKQNTSIVHIT